MPLRGTDYYTQRMLAYERAKEGAKDREERKAARLQRLGMGIAEPLIKSGVELGVGATKEYFPTATQKREHATAQEGRAEKGFESEQMETWKTAHQAAETQRIMADIARAETDKRAQGVPSPGAQGVPSPGAQRVPSPGAQGVPSPAPSLRPVGMSGGRGPAPTVLSRGAEPGRKTPYSSPMRGAGDIPITSPGTPAPQQSPGPVPTGGATGRHGVAAQSLNRLNLSQPDTGSKQGPAVEFGRPAPDRAGPTEAKQTIDDFSVLLKQAYDQGLKGQAVRDFVDKRLPSVNPRAAQELILQNTRQGELVQKAQDWALEVSKQDPARDPRKIPGTTLRPDVRKGADPTKAGSFVEKPTQARRKSGTGGGRGRKFKTKYFQLLKEEVEVTHNLTMKQYQALPEKSDDPAVLTKSGIIAGLEKKVAKRARSKGASRSDIAAAREFTRREVERNKKEIADKQHALKNKEQTLKQRKALLAGITALRKKVKVTQSNILRTETSTTEKWVLPSKAELDLMKELGMPEVTPPQGSPVPNKRTREKTEAGYKAFEDDLRKQGITITPGHREIFFADD